MKPLNSFIVMDIELSTKGKHNNVWLA